MAIPREFWTLPHSSLLEALQADESGLSAQDAAARLRRYGPNRPVHARPLGQLRQLLRLLANPMVMILLAAALIATALGEATDAAIIVVIVAASLMLNSVQSYRSQRAAEALKQSVAARARVRRGGREVEVPAEAVVPGDVIALAAGDMVPADARLLESKDLFVDQASLTGESYPAEKHVRELAADHLDVSEAANAVFAGTSIVSGTGRAIVVRTGERSYFGTVASSLAAAAPPTEFERGLMQFSMLVLRVVVALTLFVFLVLSIVKHEPMEAFLFALALAVGLTPEFLPMILTITLTRGAMRMARHRVIVKQLQAIENFGSIDVLCTDKTGTLTEGQLALTRWTDWRGRPSEEALEAGILNSRFETGIKSPLDEAILRARPPEPERWMKLDEIPFDFHRRRLSVVVERDERRMMIVKGAPEAVLPVCRECREAGGDTPFSAERRAEAEAAFQAMSEAGLRVLAIASRVVTRDPPFEPADEADLVLLGFLAFADPPRADAKDTLAGLARDGIRVVMLTGDNEWVARHVGEAVGLASGRMVLGHELEAIRDEALPRVVEDIRIFARLTPEQKTRVIRAFKHAGHVVGFLGDGINDAPALRTADVGISVNTAVEVAKDAAPIILLEKSLSRLHEGVLEGRRSFANVMKYLMMGTSSSFGNMFSMAGAAMFLPFLPMLPLQILLNNLLYDLSQVSIPSDRVEQEALAHPRRWNIGFLQRFMLYMGPVSSLFDILTFALLLAVFMASEALFHTGWFVESLLTQTLVIFVIRTHGNPFTNRPSTALTVTVLSVCAIGVALPYTPLAPRLGLVPMPPTLLGAIVAMVVAYMALAQAVKSKFYRDVMRSELKRPPARAP